MKPHPILPYSLWVATSLATRQKFAQQFGIAKVRSISVVNDYVADDGYDVHNVEKAISVVNLQSYLESKDTDIIALFNLAIDKFEGKIPNISPEKSTETTETVQEEPIIKTRKTRTPNKK